MLINSNAVNNYYTPNTLVIHFEADHGVSSIKAWVRGLELEFTAPISGNLFEYKLEEKSIFFKGAVVVVTFLDSEGADISAAIRKFLFLYDASEYGVLSFIDFNSSYRADL